MLNDKFKIRYKSVPVAISEQDDFTTTKLHNHNEFEILLINSGTCKVRVANDEYTANKGDMVFVNPMEVHEVVVNDDVPYAHQCICFDISLIINSHIGGSLKNECTSIIHFIKGDTVQGEYLGDLFGKILKSFKADDKTVGMEVPAYITLMFSYLLKNSLVDVKRASPKESKFCTDVMNYIKNHYGEKLTSKKVAEECFLNHSYFCRKFKENFGTSFSSYLNICRISESKRMLEENRDSVALISEKCGFETPTYFSKCFKSYVGVLPVEYKKGKRSS